MREDVCNVSEMTHGCYVAQTQPPANRSNDINSNSVQYEVHNEALLQNRDFAFQA